MNLALPPLREELALYPGAPLPNGQPTWTLHDPVRNQFFQLDWPTFELISRWTLGDPEAMVEDVNAHTPLSLSLSDVEALLLFLQQQQLLRPSPGQAPAFAQALQQRKGTVAQWLLHNYLFFRIPLWKPDRWLSHWVGLLEFAYQPRFYQLTALALLLGVFSVIRQWETFSSTLVDMLTWQGMLAYGVTLTSVKFLHELGHAFTAKRLGCRVPSMGLAFLVMWPVAYTDTNEVWKLTQARQRLQVASAGIMTELIVAAWATLAWGWLPEGLPKSVAFLLATTTWISTIAINASPFMRFDGYFLLADFLHMPNLHSRAFALARWDLRERLFALGEPIPEPVKPTRRAGLIVFAWMTWIYRLVLFLGIAALVYHFAVKAVGIVLFLVEMGWFVTMPFWMEFKAWHERWDHIKAQPRSRRSALVALGMVILLCVPWPNRILTSALLQPVNQYPVYAPAHAQLVGLPVTHGQRVDTDSVLLELTSPDLQMRQAQTEAKQSRLQQQSASAGFDPEQRKDWQVLDEQLHTAQAEGQTVAADTTPYLPKAPYAGVLTDLDPDLTPGQWVAHKELLGRVVGDGPWQVISYVDDDEIAHLQVGDRALFVAEGMAGPVVHLTVSRIDTDASRTLSEPELAHLFGGHVPVREKHGVFYPERAIYRVTLELTDPTEVHPQHRWRGKLSMAGAWQAPAQRFIRQAMTVLWRELGF